MSVQDYKTLHPICEATGEFIGHGGGSLAHIKAVGMGGPRKGEVCPSEVMHLTDKAHAEFDNGKAAMRIFGRWVQGGYKDNPNVDLGLVGPPAGNERYNILFWGGFGIFSGTEHPEAAWRFLKFYVGEEGSQVWKDWAIPPVESVAQEAGMYEDPLESVWIDELNRIKGRGAPLRKLVPLIPAERILVETDAPYLVPAPEKNHHRRNEPAFVKSVILKLSEVRGEDPGQLSKIIWENTCRLYRLET